MFMKKWYDKHKILLFYLIMLTLYILLNVKKNWNNLIWFFEEADDYLEDSHFGDLVQFRGDRTRLSEME